jgi:acyl CoA:acetate/3-ketoacid CoA transferase alpha subunit
LIQALLEQGKKDLTIVSNNAGTEIEKKEKKNALKMICYQDMI